MVLFPSFLLAAAIGIASYGLIHRVFGDLLGYLIDLVVFYFVFTRTKRYLKDLREG